MTSLNQVHGRAVGNEILRAVGQTLGTSLRVGHLLLRRSGDEFVLVAPRTGLESAGRLAERMRRELLAAELAVGPRELRIAVSIGVAEGRAGEVQGALIERAAAAMREARAAGGNCVRLAR
jgi:two-component system cell cycle response regulator